MPFTHTNFRTSTDITGYAKSIIYIGLAVAAVLTTALADDALSTSELVNLGIVAVGAAGTYLVPNFTTGVGKYAKAAVAFLVAGGVALQSYLTGGVSTTEWLQIIVAAFAGIGVYIAPNAASKE